MAKWSRRSFLRGLLAALGGLLGFKAASQAPAVPVTAEAETSYGYEGSGTLRSEQHSSVTTYYYDAWNRLTCIIDPPAQQPPAPGRVRRHQSDRDT